MGKRGRGLFRVGPLAILAHRIDKGVYTSGTYWRGNLVFTVTFWGAPWRGR